jgi:ADP-ribose pyrophosphatase
MPQLIDKQVLYDGKKVRLEVHHLEDDDGNRVKKEIVVHPGAVVILPFLSPDRILLLRQYRYTVGKLLHELPAGTLEKGEPPMNCAGRELREETGYLPGKLKPIGSFYASPGILTEKMHAFAAYDLRKTQQALEPGEQLEVHEVPYDHALSMIDTGDIQDAKTIATLLMFDRARHQQPRTDD